MENYTHPNVKYKDSVHRLEEKRTPQNNDKTEKKIKFYKDKIAKLSELERIDTAKLESILQLKLNTINKNLILLRKKNNLSIDDVAFFAKVSKSIVWNIENNNYYNPTMVTILKFCMFYEIEPKDLMENIAFA